MRPRRAALLHKSADGGTSPYPGQTYPATFVTGMPSAVKPFRTATRIWELGDLTFEVPCAQPLAQQFQAMHLGFDAALAVMAAPSSPDRPAEAFGCAQGRVARDCPCRAGLSTVWRSCAAG